MFSIQDQMALRKLQDNELHDTNMDLAHRYREITERVIWHLKETERRKLYLQFENVTSLYSYCTKILKYSNGSASRRVNASRLLGEMPEISEKILEGDVNLSNLSTLQSCVHAEEKRTKKKLTTAKKRELEEKIENQSQDTAEFFLAEALPNARPSREIRRICFDGDVEIAFKADPKFMAKLERIRELEAHRSMKGFCEVFEFLMTEHLKLRDPLLKKPKEKRIRPAAGRQRSNGSDSTQLKNGGTRRGSAKRIYFSKEIKYTLHKQASSQCQRIDPKAGQRCMRRHHLQIDHIVPLSRGGTNDPSNLQLLCRPHNLRKENARS